MSKQSGFVILLILILVIYQIIRLIAFAGVYGGVEGDSGMFSSIARSLAERGTYTTMTSTIVDPTIRGGINVYGRFDVQDEAGRIWFWTVNGVGPGSIGPNAIVLKLLGVSFWSLKAGTLLFCSVFLLLASFLLFYVGGVLPVILFHLFFIFYPHLLVYLGYEPFGEMATLVYILLAYLLFIKATQTQLPKTRWFFLCGLSAGLTLIAKYIGLLSLTSIFILWLIEFRQHKTNFKHLVVMTLGVVILPLAWEGVQLVTLTQLAGFETYQLHAAERISFFRDESSTMAYSLPDFNVAEFLLAKLLVVSQISQPTPIISFIMFMLIAASGPVLVYFKQNEITSKKIILLFWFGWFVHTAWFIGIAKGAWVRHDWFALIFGVILFCWLVSHFLQWARVKPTWYTLVIAGLLIVMTLSNFFSQRHAAGWLIPNRLVEIWRLDFLSNETLVGRYEQQMPWIIIPRAQQDEVIDYLSELPPTSQIFYGGNLSVAELSLVVGRVFYPIQRRSLMPHSQEDVVVVGTRAFSPWRRPQELVEPIKQEIKSQCPQLLLENDYYIICSVTN